MNLPGQRHKGLAEILLLGVLLSGFMEAYQNSQLPLKSQAARDTDWLWTPLLLLGCAAATSCSSEFHRRTSLFLKTRKLTTDHTALKAATGKPSAEKRLGGDDGCHPQKNCKPNGLFCWKLTKMNVIWECIDLKGLFMGRRKPCYAIPEVVTVKKIRSHFLKIFSFTCFVIFHFSFYSFILSSLFYSFTLFTLWFFPPHLCKIFLQ